MKMRDKRWNEEDMNLATENITITRSCWGKYGIDIMFEAKALPDGGIQITTGIDVDEDGLFTREMYRHDTIIELNGGEDEITRERTIMANAILEFQETENFDAITKWINDGAGTGLTRMYDEIKCYEERATMCIHTAPSRESCDLKTYGKVSAPTFNIMSSMFKIIHDALK